MSLYSTPPPLRPFQEDKPTLLVCWWATLFCTTIILFRVAGRFVRSETLFSEDKTAALAIIPLFLRMGLVQVVLTYGTNNAELPADLSNEEIHRRSVGSGLVLASRIFYAAALWILKSAILEFFKRLIRKTWKTSYEITLLCIRCTLALTFIAVIISDLAECHPFPHYYQVLPDPGGQCRQGFAQLITMATCNVITDLLLVLFPVPIILTSHMSVKRKVQLVLLFSLSLGPVGVTLYRVPHIIRAHGSQQRRSLLASVELIFATAAANALVLGSFVRDRGTKKARFRYNSSGFESADESGRSRRPTIQRQWGSLEDLVGDLGLGVNRELRDGSDVESQQEERNYTTAAPVTRPMDDMSNWQFPQRRLSNAERSDVALLPRNQSNSSRNNNSAQPRRVSFFDAGGSVADEQDEGSNKRSSANSSIVDPLSPNAHRPPSPTVPASTAGVRRGSQALLRDLGGLMGRSGSQTAKGGPRSNSGGTELQPIQHRPRRASYRAGDYISGPTLMDPGGLLR